MDLNVTENRCFIDKSTELPLIVLRDYRLSRSGDVSQNSYNHLKKKKKTNTPPFPNCIVFMRLYFFKYLNLKNLSQTGCSSSYETPAIFFILLDFKEICKDVKQCHFFLTSILFYFGKYS